MSLFSPSPSTPGMRFWILTIFPSLISTRILLRSGCQPQYPTLNRSSFIDVPAAAAIGLGSAFTREAKSFCSLAVSDWNIAV